MLNALKKILGMGPSVNLGELIKNGAIILDVRTKAEYQMGHVKGSINIPLDQLTSNLNKLDKNKPIITCCASGMRSGSAKGVLQNRGFTQVYNGGSWQNVNRYI
ncbi:MAG: rhodanese-like domain-containing protein [Flavobacteriales bacterium]|nr:rhodanese-like domain-containing protein [Flavobacteriales bacterium]